MTIPQAFQEYYQKHHFKELTPIQAQVYEPLSQGASVLALAPTGSGKTLAFGMPLVQTVQPEGGVQAIIIEPSQELAIQTRDTIRELNPQLQVYGLIGGANIKRQIEHLKTKPEVIVGTIGRLFDLVEKRKLKLKNVQHVIIDEADVMLSDKLGEVRSLLSRIPADFQLALFSATVAPIFEQLSRWFNQQFMTIDLRQTGNFRAGIKHYFLLTSNAHKADVVQQLAHRLKKSNLVFYQSSKELHHWAADMRYRRTYFAVLDTSDPKKRREDALKALRNHKTSLLLTTDVAARGMDITGLSTVINFNNPQDLTQYIHRSGRTGRMGSNGEVITLGNEHDYRQLQNMLRPAKIRLQQVQLQDKKLLLNNASTAPRVTFKKKKTHGSKNKGQHNK
ncbi:DEAD/DEAH box helicase [Bombilactobacillus thymidiniphilus]|uniref:DEAD/DEAH box helicase n=1 Tax=Bombilactobacillus thymidiniphilus TaxID=2923363 RepID=A0ABY4PC31_9LACO|nr:DEAD/DEAH box helicase [Bombilactobacillus thymidiniphilus]UQS83246.1 DEAD/DEAH box helicase [Bombilactobacillus thymidiniphilus]